ncbi:MAG: kinase/pyrophosphorylase, partial [Alphaproteobacteria bacterium]
IGLTTAPERLVQVRRNRIKLLQRDDRTDYVDPEQVNLEITEARKLFSKMHWPVIDVSRRSIEETAAAIIQHYNAFRENASGTEKLGSS